MNFKIVSELLEHPLYSQFIIFQNIFFLSLFFDTKSVTIVSKSISKLRSIFINAKLDNLSWPVVFRMYVLILRSQFLNLK